MSRTPGSGWGAGPILYQVCECCGKKKAYYDWNDYGAGQFKCTYCKVRFDSCSLERKKYKDLTAVKHLDKKEILK